ncbi:MAG: tRNA (adenosine(37)-N6)-threonylcarbamoyltransferase complex dimerization subunit type 1 TsaB [Devosia sp.]|jgi:tRNA threonylcarbamoyladenosine biosynthesis protein TsaB
MTQSPGIVLAIDTAAPRLQLALLLADGRVDVSIDEMATGQAEAIFGRIAALLARNGVGYADLSRVVTTTGPGSFTGLRIGLSAARGIGLARGIAVIGVPSLLALSLSVEGPSTVLLDARRGEAYFQIFAGAGVALTPPDLVAMALAQAATPPETTLISSPFVDIALVAQYGAVADPATHVPEAAYVRDADAKPQTAGRVERTRT